MCSGLATGAPSAAAPGPSCTQPQARPRPRARARRWQAAINSGGKYLYLGSFVLEDDAARAFDRAAIKLRNKKAKLNFAYDDYVGAGGLRLCAGSGQGCCGPRR
jgi:hypothetical protein